MEFSAKTRPCLWFKEKGYEAAKFYCSLLPDSFIENEVGGAPGNPFIVEFTLGGTPYMIMNAGDMFRLNEAFSISVLTKDQVETDKLWAALTADGGAPSMCAWLKDRYGVSWQIVPEVLPRLLNSEDPAVAERARDAMLKMQKIDIAALEAAARGD